MTVVLCCVKVEQNTTKQNDWTWFKRLLIIKKYNWKKVILGFYISCVVSQYFMIFDIVQEQCKKLLILTVTSECITAAPKNPVFIVHVYSLGLHIIYYCSFVKECQPPIFGLISCIKSKFARIITHPRANFVYQKIEKPSLKCCTYLRKKLRVILNCNAFVCR